MPSVTLLQDWIICKLPLRAAETWHISLSFVTTGSGTKSVGQDDMKLLNRSGPVFCVDRSNCNYDIFDCAETETTKKNNEKKPLWYLKRLN